MMAAFRYYTTRFRLHAIHLDRIEVSYADLGYTVSNSRNFKKLKKYDISRVFRVSRGSVNSIVRSWD